MLPTLAFIDLSTLGLGRKIDINLSLIVSIEEEQQLTPWRRVSTQIRMADGARYDVPCPKDQVYQNINEAVRMLEERD